MLSASVSQLQDFVLQGDAIAPRSFQVYVNGDRIIQDNGTNPRIRPAGTQELGAIAIAQDRIIDQVYVVRIVKRGVSAAIVPGSTWELSFDGGITKLPCRVIPPIRESKVQGVSWEIDLELTRV